MCAERGETTGVPVRHSATWVTRPRVPGPFLFAARQQRINLRPAIHDWQSSGCDLSGSRWLLDKLSPAPKRSRPGPATALPIKEVAALGALLFCGLRAAIDGPVTFRTSRSPARSDIWGNDRPLCPQPPGGPDEPRSVPPSRGSFIGGLGVTDFRREGCCPIFGTTRRHLSAKLREWP